MTDPASHALHLSALAAEQRANAGLLALAVADASRAGLSWQAIGRALGITGATAYRQHKAGSPVSVLRPFQSVKSPRARGVA